MCEQIESIFKEIFPSTEMASYLAKCSLKRWQIRNAVAYAAIPLERKRDMFLQLASGKNKSNFRLQAGIIEQAIREMRPKPGEFFYLKSFRYFEEDGITEEGLGPYLVWEHIFECIQEFLGYLSADKQELAWFEVEKWSPDGTGRLKNDYNYTVFGTKVCYFSRNASSRRGRYKLSTDRYQFSTDKDLNLPVPFRAGDIVTIDCRPFAPVSHSVILEVGDNQDCCCLQALYREGNGIWSTGAVKHGYVSSDDLWTSPLYRLATFRGQLPKEERLLEQVSSFLEGDEERGSALWNYIYRYGEKEMAWTVTETQILSYMENGDDA